MGTLQKCTSVHASFHNCFNHERHLIDRATYKTRRFAAMVEWKILQADVSQRRLPARRFRYIDSAYGALAAHSRPPGLLFSWSLALCGAPQIQLTCTTLMMYATFYNYLAELLNMKRFRTRLRIGFALVALAAVAFSSAAGLRWSDAQASTPSTYSIDFYTISTGGNTLSGNCYRLSGTVGQVAPGYSSGSIDSLIAGYWQPAPTAATDEIFFNGFEVC